MPLAQAIVDQPFSDNDRGDQPAKLLRVEKRDVTLIPQKERQEDGDGRDDCVDTDLRELFESSTGLFRDHSWFPLMV